MPIVTGEFPIYASAKTFSVAGAASTPGVSTTGAWFTGGSATTTKPQVLVEPSGTTSTGWGTSGTGLGVNAASGFAGNLVDFQLAGVSKFRVALTGNSLLTAAGSVVVTTGSGSLFRITDATGTVDITPSTNMIAFGNSADVSLKRLATGALARSEVIPANANYGAFSIGSGPFDGTTAGFFVGSASGTGLAINAAAGFAGDLFNFQVAGVGRSKQAASTGLLTVTGVATAGGAGLLTITPGAHTAVTAEVLDYNHAVHTMTITGGYATQRFALFDQPTISAASALTVTTAATVAIAAAPTVAASAVITNAHSFWVQAGSSRFDGVVKVKGATSATAGGVSAIILGSGTQDAGVLGVYFGSGAPSVSAGQGSLYLRTEGSTGITRAYINTDGGTTWTAITTVA